MAPPHSLRSVPPAGAPGGLGSGPASAGKALSLKGRALQLLAQRDQSRVELRRKLLRAQDVAARDPAAGHGSLGGDERNGRYSAEGEVDAVLDWLEANRYLSAERFVESRVHAREGRYGNLRIRAELAQHGMKLAPDTAQALRQTELDRALAVRERRFAEAPADTAARARQARFLAARGFSPDTIQQVFRRLQTS